MIDARPRRTRSRAPARRPQSRIFPTAERLVYSPINYRLSLIVDVTGAAMFLLIGLWTPASWIAKGASASVGFAAWGFLEYAIHRWIGHGPPSIARRGHAEHHSDGEALIAAPFFMIFVGALCVWAALSSVAPTAIASLLVFGAYVGYNNYALLHHVLHHYEALAVQTGLDRIERNHRIHHERPSVNFGVTSTLWDRVFGTYQPLAPEDSWGGRPGFSRTTRSYATSSSDKPSATSCE